MAARAELGQPLFNLAKAFGATVYATAGSDEKCAACCNLGADMAINYKNDWAAEIRTATKKRGVDVILDMVGGDYIQKNIDSLAVDGRLASSLFLKAQQNLH